MDDLIKKAQDLLDQTTELEAMIRGVIGGVVRDDPLTQTDLKQCRQIIKNSVPASL